MQEFLKLTSTELRAAFRIKKGKVDLADEFLPPSASEKLGLTARTLLPGMISFHEEHSTRVQGGYKLHEWYELEPTERAFEVAIRRVDGLISRHIAEAGK